MRRRRGDDPKRRIQPAGTLSETELGALADLLTYVGSANHKTKPGNYGFHPPANPRPWKSPCDDLRVVLRQEAAALLRRGILKAMFSRLDAAGCPKYVWAVDDTGEPYEAKASGDGTYHGYRLLVDDDMRQTVITEWKKR